jgi:hypothetical protein
MCCQALHAQQANEDEFFYTVHVVLTTAIKESMGEKKPEAIWEPRSGLNACLPVCLSLHIRDAS